MAASTASNIICRQNLTGFARGDAECSSSRSHCQSEMNLTSGHHRGLPLTSKGARALSGSGAGILLYRQLNAQSKVASERHAGIFDLTGMSSCCLLGSSFLAGMPTSRPSLCRRRSPSSAHTRCSASELFDHESSKSGDQQEPVGERVLETKVGHGEKALKGDPVIIGAMITGSTEEFFASEADGSDPDRPTEGFSSIVEAVEAIRNGQFVVVVDDEDRENEGDLILAGSKATAEKIAFMTRHTSGVICVGMTGERLDALDIPLMVSDHQNEEALLTAFTVTVDARAGTTTGISASDRAATIQLLSDPAAAPRQFKKPGHIFPLRYREGGVLKRAGHTEASVDLAVMAGLPPAGVLSEITTDDKAGMARLPELRAFARTHGLPLISIADLVRYKRKRERIVERTAVARLPTQWGDFEAYSYRSKLDGIEHVAMVKGHVGDGMDVLVRVHSECLTGDIFGSRRCDCGPQLQLAMQKIEREGRGVVVYLRGHEGRGIGLGHKLRAYNLQDAGRDTVEANVELGLPIDSREYGVGAQILRDIGVRTMRLMTNNPAKYMGLRGYGLAVTGRVPVFTAVTAENRRYLETKRSKMGHVYGSDIPTGTGGGFTSSSVEDASASSAAMQGSSSNGAGAATATAAVAAAEAKKNGATVAHENGAAAASSSSHR